MILNEETFDILNFDVPDVTNADIEVSDMDTTVPEAGPEVGVETLLMQAIKDIYGIIEGYNSLSIALTDIGNEPAAISVADIIKMEHANIGVLQDILAEISPNAEAVNINESLNEDRYARSNVFAAVEEGVGSNYDYNSDTNDFYLFKCTKDTAYNIKNRIEELTSFRYENPELIYKLTFKKDVDDDWDDDFDESLNEGWDNSYDYAQYYYENPVPITELEKIVKKDGHDDKFFKEVLNDLDEIAWADAEEEI